MLLFSFLSLKLISAAEFTNAAEKFFEDEFDNFATYNLNTTVQNADFHLTHGNILSSNSVFDNYKIGMGITPEKKKILKSAIYTKVCIKSGQVATVPFPTYLALSRNLKKLVVENMIITSDVGSNAGCHYLEELELHGCIMSDITSILPNPCSVKKITIKNCKIAKNSISVEKLYCLQNISITNSNLSAVPDKLLTLEKLVNVDFSENSLTVFPEFNKDDKIKLQSLSLKGNLFSEIPKSMSNLRRLKYLDMSDNKLMNIEYKFDQNPLLETLNLSFNSIQETPKLWTHPHLKTLDISYNKITSLPLKLFISSTIIQVDAGFNRIKEFIPISDENTTLYDRLLNSHSRGENSIIPPIKKLSLRYNELSYLPIFFKSCVCLVSLNLAGNSFEYFPGFLSSLKRLEILDLSYNLLTEITIRLDDHPSLIKLDLQGGKNFKLPDIYANNIKLIPSAFLIDAFARDGFQLHFTRDTLANYSDIFNLGSTVLDSSRFAENIILY